MSAMPRKVLVLTIVSCAGLLLAVAGLLGLYLETNRQGDAVQREAAQAVEALCQVLLAYRDAGEALPPSTPFGRELVRRTEALAMQFRCAA